MTNLTTNGIRMIGRLVILLVRLRCHVRLLLSRYVIVLVILVVFIRLILIIVLIALCMVDMTRATTFEIAINMTSSINITRTRNMGQMFNVTRTIAGTRKIAACDRLLWLRLYTVLLSSHVHVHVLVRTRAIIYMIIVLR